MGAARDRPARRPGPDSQVHRRAVAIGDIDLNLFTGRFAVKGFRLGDRDGPELFAEFDRLAVQVSPLALLQSRVDLVDVALTAPSLRIGAGPAEFELLRSADARPARLSSSAAPSSRWIRVPRAQTHRARAGGRVADDAIEPPA